MALSFVLVSAQLRACSILFLGAVFGIAGADAQVIKYSPDQQLTAPRPLGAALYAQRVVANGEWLAVHSRAELHPQGPHSLPRGAVHLYRDVGVGWRWTQSLWTPTFQGTTVGFGDSIAFGDRGELFIGMPNAYTSGPFTGAVFRYELGAGSWRLAERIDSPLSGGILGGEFGSGMSYRDGRLLVSAPSHYESAGVSRGRICAYEKLAGVWSLTSVLVPPAPISGLGAIGRAFVDSGDHIFVSESTPQRVLVYGLDAGVWTLEQTIFRPTPMSSGDRFASSIAYSSGVLAVADRRATSSLSPGLVYLYEEIGGQWTRTQSLRSGSGETDYFGDAISIRGNRLLVGVPGYNRNVDPLDLPSALLYEKQLDGEWTLSRLLQFRQRSIQGFFGESVFLGEGYALVGDSLGGVLAGQNAGTMSVYSLPLGRSFCGGGGLGGQALPELQLGGVIYRGRESVTASVANAQGYDFLSVYRSLRFSDNPAASGPMQGTCLAQPSYLCAGPRLLNTGDSGPFECEMAGGASSSALSGMTIGFQAVLSGALGDTVSNAVAVTWP